MSEPTPFALTSATRFQPSRVRAHSRSPSRSPQRKSAFAARELDPLLSNLSPDSTLEALRATSTIGSEISGQDALARSIAEATPSEREIGIRAAVAAQKLKQWYREVLQWPWPGRRDRGWGAGFLPPQKNPGPNPVSSVEEVQYLGCLPAHQVEEYQERIEDIRDGLEALELEDIKEHVFDAHMPQHSISTGSEHSSSSDSLSSGYGRMRDFTALVTATVIQALPELSNLNLLLDTWDIRLSVLRQIPDITKSFRSTRAAVQTAFIVIRSMITGPLVTRHEYETTKHILGNEVASLGAKVDKLLDALEGREDSLPKSWIDTLEIIESDYAAWTVEAEHVVIRNNLLAKALIEQPNPVHRHVTVTPDIPNDHMGVAKPAFEHSTLATVREMVGENQDSANLIELPVNEPIEIVSPSPRHTRKSDTLEKPPLTVNVPASGHRRGMSQVSMAESALSAMTDISAAEIVDARSTQVVTSPKISVVDNPLPPSRDEPSWFTGTSLDHAPGNRPPMIQRASTASIEMVSRNSVRQVTLARSRSHDMLGQTSPPSPWSSTPSQALQQLTGLTSRTTPPIDENEAMVSPEPVATSNMAIDAPSSTVSANPSLRVAPLQLKTRDTPDVPSESPELPRRSSRRLSQNVQLEPNQIAELASVRTPDTSEKPPILVTPVRPVVEHSETLESRIKGILSSMPDKVRLARDTEHERGHNSVSGSSTRSSTPIPALTLSPVKADRAGQKASPGDVRVFHLSRSGQTRDVPPVKLFVRAVGENGERVMVRVGGGWADLAEYLREYSLHHGHKGIADGNLEVANFPASAGAQKDSVATSASILNNGQNKPHVGSIPSTSKRTSLPNALSHPGELPPLSVNKTRKALRPRFDEAPSPQSDKEWTPPPVPPIPVTYTMQTPTTVTMTTNGVTTTRTIEPPVNVFPSSAESMSTPVRTSNLAGNSNTPTGSTTSTPPGGAPTYTPLGAAGPRSGGRRVTSYNVSSNLDRESWVEGMVGKARAVSGGTTFVQGPTMTTTTTVISRSTPNRQRMSAVVNSSPANSPAARSSPGNGASPAPASTPGTASPADSNMKDSPSPARSKSRMSIGDVSGIRRVFLRRKSDK